MQVIDEIIDLHLYLKCHSSTGVFQTFWLEKPTTWFLHKSNIGWKWVKQVYVEFMEVACLMELPLKTGRKLNEHKISRELQAVIQRYSIKKVLLKISQNSQENTCGRVFF